MLVAIRCRTSLDGCEPERRGNHESVLLEPDEWKERFPHDRDAVARTAELAERLEFDLTEDLGYRYPDFSDTGEPAIRQLAGVCDRAFEERYGDANGHKRRARNRLDEELKLIDELGLAGFFLLHWEVLELARECALEVRGRLRRAQRPAARAGARQLGRLDRLLPDRPLARRPGARRALARPLHQPRARLGAGHRPRLPARHPREADRRGLRALRPRALGARRELLDLPRARRDPRHRQGARAAVRRARAARAPDRRQPDRVGEELAKLPDADAKRASPRWRAFAQLCREIAGLPRHISQHPGGMVISTRPLVELVPVQPAAMEGRQLCQWDKDSCADAGFLKIDLLGLGMLSAVEDCVEQIVVGRGKPIDLSRIPLDDEAVYGEIQRGRHRRRLPDREPRADADRCCARCPRTSTT